MLYMITRQPRMRVNLILDLFVTRDLSLESTFNLFHGRYVFRHVPCHVGGFKYTWFGCDKPNIQFFTSL